MRAPKTTAIPTIAVLLDNDFGYGARVLEGVRAFARRAVRWRLLPLHSTQDQLLDRLLRERRVDGVVGAFVSDRWVQGLADGHVPMVNVGNASEIHAVPSVVPDDAAIGRLAARHLLERGWRSLAGVHESASHAARARFEGFAAAAGGSVLTPPRSGTYATDATWDAWIDGLPRPFAVFCTSDFLARKLVQHLEGRGCRVPTDAAVVGVGDSVLDSVLAGLPLSSVVLPAERIGERAAARLHALLEGRPDDGQTERVPPETMAVRESSSRLLLHGPLVGRALAFMDERLAEAIDVAMIAKACGGARRTLELAFRAEFGRGPAAVLQDRRHELACRLLTETGLPLGEIALAAGFRDPSRFWTSFRAREGRTPGVFRSEHAARAAR